MKDENIWGEKIVITDTNMFPSQESLCIWCLHRYANTLQCAAFKGDIPLRFLTNEKQHTEPTQGDSGLLFVDIREVF